MGAIASSSASAKAGWAKVYKVTHAQLGKTFALKIIREKAERRGERRSSKRASCSIAKRDWPAHFRIPHIASVVDFGEDDNLGAFMVMEFLDGEPLSRLHPP